MIYLVYIGLYLTIMSGTFSFGIYKLIHKCFVSGGINLGIGITMIGILILLWEKVKDFRM
jgi:hypothetical protein